MRGCVVNLNYDTPSFSFSSGGDGARAPSGDRLRAGRGSGNPRVGEMEDNKYFLMIMSNLSCRPDVIKTARR